LAETLAKATMGLFFHSCTFYILQCTSKLTWIVMQYFEAEHLYLKSHKTNTFMAFDNGLY